VCGDVAGCGVVFGAGVWAAAESGGGGVEGPDASLECGAGGVGGAAVGVVEVEREVADVGGVDGVEEGHDIGGEGDADGFAEVDVGGVPCVVVGKECAEGIEDAADGVGSDGAGEWAGDDGGDVEAYGHAGVDGAGDDGAEALDGVGDGGVGVALVEGFGGGGEEGEFEGDA